jgi:hypothetical protein
MNPFRLAGQRIEGHDREKPGADLSAKKGLQREERHPRLFAGGKGRKKRRPNPLHHGDASLLHQTARRRT